MNFRKSSKGGVISNPKIYVADFCHYKGYFGHEFWKKIRNMIFRKWGGGVNGRLELFRKFIRFWRDRLPLLRLFKNGWGCSLISSRNFILFDDSKKYFFLRSYFSEIFQHFLRSDAGGGWHVKMITRLTWQFPKIPKSCTAQEVDKDIHYGTLKLIEVNKCKILSIK